MDHKLETYLAEMAKQLRFLPDSEKTDILNELRSSFADMTANGSTPDEIIGKMGSPKELASEYRETSNRKTEPRTWNRVWTTAGYYSLASLLWISVIPVLASLTVAFMFSSVACVVAGILVSLKPFIRFYPSDLRLFNLFGYHPEGIAAVLTGILLAVVFFLLGRLFWKLTVNTVQKLNDGRFKLS